MSGESSESFYSLWEGCSEQLGKYSLKCLYIFPFILQPRSDTCQDRCKHLVWTLKAWNHSHNSFWVLFIAAGYRCLNALQFRAWVFITTLNFSFLGFGCFSGMVLCEWTFQCGQSWGMCQSVVHVHDLVVDIWENSAFGVLRSLLQSQVLCRHEQNLHTVSRLRKPELQWVRLRSSFGFSQGVPGGSSDEGVWINFCLQGTTLFCALQRASTHCCRGSLLSKGLSLMCFMCWYCLKDRSDLSCNLSLCWVQSLPWAALGCVGRELCWGWDVTHLVCWPGTPLLGVPL